MRRSFARTIRAEPFKRTDVPFKMGGNEPGRFNGERLAVDPNEGDILFFGSRRDGLWKSADRGATWQKVESFPNIGSNQPPPAASATTTNAAGWRRGGGFGWQSSRSASSSVVFDPASGKPGSPTPQLYAAVSTTETNLYCSTDGGVTWQAVANQPVGLRPNHLVLSPDGMFYLSYGREPGPECDERWRGLEIQPERRRLDGHHAGQAAGIPTSRSATAASRWTRSIRPPSWSTTFAHWHPHDEIFRSTNGGASWMQLWDDNTQWDHSSAPYTQTRTPHWMGTIVINPFDSDQVLFTTGLWHLELHRCDEG